MTSPFLLAQKPKEEQQQQTEVGQTTRRPSSLLVPLQSQIPEDVEPRSLWQQKVDAQRQQFDLRLQQNTITPKAASLPSGTYTNIFPIIQGIGETALAGQTAASEKIAQRKIQIENARIAAEHQKAIDEAYKRIAELETGAAGPNRTIPGVAGIPGGTGASNSGPVTWDGSDAALADMMRKAGFPADQIGIGLRIAHLESGLRPTVAHDNPNGSTDRGIFQINSIHKNIYSSAAALFDPQYNVDIAFKVWQQAGGSWKPWTTYSNALRQGALPVPQTRLTGIPTVSGGVTANANGVLRNAAVNKAMVVLNLPYVWGGNSLTTGVDCSGLVQQVYKQLGIATPRQARAQAAEGAVGHRVGSVSQLQPGDLVAFQWAGGYAGPNTVSHIAIYAGNGQIIESYGGAHGRIRALDNRAQDKGAIYIHVRFPGE